MPKYNVKVKQHMSFNKTVEAKSQKEAKKLVLDSIVDSDIDPEHVEIEDAKVSLIKKEKKPKYTPYSKKWLEAAFILMQGYCPQLYPCVECKGPVLNGYVCDHCECVDPSGPEGDDYVDETEYWA